MRHGEPRARLAPRGMAHLARLLQFSDSTLPIGSFAFSNGLESALQTGIVTDTSSLLHFVELVLHQNARVDGVALLHAHRATLAEDYSGIVTADRELLCRRVGEEQQLMLTRMGKKLAELALKIGPSPVLERWLADIRSDTTPAACRSVRRSPSHISARTRRTPSSSTNTAWPR